MYNAKYSEYDTYDNSGDTVDYENFDYGESDTQDTDTNDTPEYEYIDDAKQMLETCDDVEIDGYVQFLRDMQQYPLLSSNEEAALFKQLKETEPGSKQYKIIKDKLMESNLRLVMKIVNDEFRYSTSVAMGTLDMIQEGIFGLNIAIDRFDISRGFKFSTLATYWIRQKIQRAIADHGLNYHVSPSKHLKMKRVMAIRNRLENELGRLPTIQELATESGVRATEVEELVHIATPLFSTDMAYTKDGEPATAGEQVVTIGTRVADESTSHIEDDFVYEDDKKRILDIANKCLSGITYEIFSKRHLQEIPETFESLGKRLGYSREYVRRLDNKAMLAIRYIYKYGHTPPSRKRRSSKEDNQKE